MCSNNENINEMIGIESKKVLLELIKNNCKNIIDILIGYGVDVTFEDNEPIKLATRCGYIDIVKSLIEAGADPRYAITDAVKKQNFDILKLLEEKEVDISEYINNEKNMALFYAYRNTDVKMVKYLIRKGVKVENNFNSLMFSELINGKNELDIAKILTMIIKRGIDINIISDIEINKIVSKGYTRILKILLKNGLILKDNTLNN